jgi:D-alanyl-D-alanine carboxypeptidase/D-alanyl-D-alanine-endopeptidase (penicillin-binding protein 4)
MPLPTAGTQPPPPAGAALAAALGPRLADKALGRVSAVVRDAATGTTLLDVAGSTPQPPASVLKLLSAAVVDATIPPMSTLTTSVVRGATPDRIVLVAGGDTLLDPGVGHAESVPGRAGLADLAQATAAALAAAGVSAVTLSVDATYAPGPASAPTWPASYLSTGITGPVAALGLSTQRATPGHPVTSDPVAEVAKAFVARLTERGVTVTFDKAPATAPPGSAPLASVASAPVGDQLALALLESDNALTESLTRQAAFRAGRPSDFAGAAAYVRERLTQLGVDITGVSTVDASGLTKADAVPARVIADVLALGLADTVAGLRATLAALPVAGLSGTLADRFQSADTHAVAGVVRAKTGTLTGVNTLAGTLVDADGRLLTFTVLAHATAEPDPARAALDRVVATLASCGCR